jgi:WD40 repeat protein
VAAKLRELRETDGEEDAPPPQSPLDIVRTLNLVEKIWIKATEASDGLDEEEFVDFLSAIMHLSRDEISILFQKMDANSDGTLSWDEYLSYILRDVAHKWSFRDARGTFHLRENDLMPTDVGVPVKQVIALPRDPVANTGPRFAFSCVDSSVQIWDAQSLGFICYLPLAPAQGGALQAQLPAFLSSFSVSERLGARHSTLAKAAASASTAGPTASNSTPDSREADGKNESKQAGGASGLEKKEARLRAAADSPRAARVPALALGGLQNSAGAGAQPKAQTARRPSVTRAASHAPGGPLTARREGGSALSNRGSESAPPAGGNGHLRLDFDVAAVLGGKGAIPFSSARQSMALPHAAIAYYAAQRQLVVATLDRQILFFSPAFRSYSLTTSFLCGETPQCLAVESHPSTGAALLVVGDARGSIWIYEAESKRRVVTLERIHGTEAVRQARMIAGLGLVSTGLDARVAIIDADRWQVVRYLCGHERGIYSFAYSGVHRCLFTTGFDGQVLVWDPYYQKPIGRLNVQHNNVIEVLLNESRNQIITVSRDKKIRVFDVRNFRCIQSLVDTSQHAPYDELSAAAFDAEHQRLITVGSRMRFWPVQTAPGNRVNRGGPAHSNLILNVCFSRVFKLLLSVGVDETVRLWDITTGKNVFTFSAHHSAPLTTASLDHRGKRILTASTNGEVRVWNFNNGACMHEFEPVHREITQLLYLPLSQNTVVGATAGRWLMRWPDPSVAKTVPLLEQDAIDVDITCVSSHGSVLVTGTSDGSIIVWFVDSARISSRVRLPDPDGEQRRAQPQQQQQKQKQQQQQQQQANKARRASLGDGGAARRLAIPCAVSRVGFMTKPGSVILVAATEGGWLHFLTERTWKLLASIRAFDEGVSGVAFDERGTRLMAVDSQHGAKIWDVSALGTEPCSEDKLPLVRAWMTHEHARVSDLIVVEYDGASAFCTASDSGDIVLWTFEGSELARFGQAAPWPLLPAQAVAASTSLNSLAESAASEGDAAAGEAETSDAVQRAHERDAHALQPTAAQRQLQALLERPRYAEVHPPYVPHTLAKAEMREEVNAGPRLRAQELRRELEEKKSGKRAEVGPQSGARTVTALEAKLGMLDAQSRRRDEADQRAANRLGVSRGGIAVLRKASAGVGATPPSKLRKPAFGRQTSLAAAESTAALPSSS